MLEDIVLKALQQNVSRKGFKTLKGSFSLKSIHTKVGRLFMQSAIDSGEDVEGKWAQEFAPPIQEIRKALITLIARKQVATNRRKSWYHCNFWLTNPKYAPTLGPLSKLRDTSP
jgi:hypothetical protein